MKTLLTAASFACLSLAIVPVFAAQSMDNRMCNLQGREIALRISEEVSEGISASERNRIASIAEEVCMGFAVESVSTDSTLTVIQGPSAEQAVSSSQAVTIPARVEVGAGESVEEDVEKEDGGLFGDLRIIEPEDRVQRPGLKRR